MNSLTNNAETLTLVQLGNKTGLHFQGSVQGILPLGPNGVPPRNGSSPLSNPEVAAGVISYDYNLNQQGLKSNVNCSYAPTHPFHGAYFPPNSSTPLAIAYHVNCTDQGKTDLINVPVLQSPWTNKTLVYWACQDKIPTASYTIYLAGVFEYESWVGNITCVVNPIQSTMYSVMYRSTEDVFSAMEANFPSSPITLSTIINKALAQLGQLISDSQNYDDNIFAETIIDLGIKSFGSPADMPPAQYLSLYEQMIQGIIEYEVCPVNYFISLLSLIH